MFILSVIAYVMCICLIRPITGRSTLKEGLPGEELDCGILLAELTSKCGSVKYSTYLNCCVALQAWNDGLCWCDTNAFKAASNLAMDFFSFQFRANNCNVTSPFRPEISLPSSSMEKIPSTCPNEITSKEEPSVSESCEGGRSKTLIKSRRGVLERLRKLNVFREADIAEWSMDLDTIFAPEAALFSIGMSFSFPRVNVKKSLLTRSTLYGGALWKSTIHQESIIWRSSNSASYVSESTYGPFAYTRVEFVLFEQCSPRITHLFTQEEEAVRLFRQFVYFDPSDRILWRIQRSSISWCHKISRICGPEHFPFRSLETCLNTYRQFKSGKVTCTAQGSRSSLTALHGNTLACRNVYLSLARLNRKVYCPFLGGRGMGLCRPSGCLQSWYEDVFKTKNPRFDSTVAFKCSSRDCFEDWPIQEGDRQDGDSDHESDDDDYEG